MQVRKEDESQRVFTRYEAIGDQHRVLTIRHEDALFEDPPGHLIAPNR
jgi:hypothetical protein